MNNEINRGINFHEFMQRLSNLIKPKNAKLESEINAFDGKTKR